MNSRHKRFLLSSSQIHFLGCTSQYASDILGCTSQFLGEGCELTMGTALQDKTVVVVARGSGVARAVKLLARSEGARVGVAGRDKRKLGHAYHDPGITAAAVDVTDDASIAAV